MQPDLPDRQEQASLEAEARLEAEELRARREAWEQQDRPEPAAPPGRPARKGRRDKSGPPAQPERRAARVQLARLETPDLLALLGLPGPGVRLDPPGLVVLRVRLGPLE